MRNKNVHDKRPYYDRRIEPLVDPEWNRANEADEKEQYYWTQMFNGGRCVKKYKPSVAELVRRRTKLAIEPWRGEETCTKNAK